METSGGHQKDWIVDRKNGRFLCGAKWTQVQEQTGTVAIPGGQGGSQQLRLQNGEDDGDVVAETRQTRHQPQSPNQTNSLHFQTAGDDDSESPQKSRQDRSQARTSRTAEATLLGEATSKPPLL